MESTPNGWRVFDASMPVLTYTYPFGPGLANALAVGGSSGLLVVSAPRRVGQGVFEDLLRFGRVRALIASNAFHHMGIAEWKRRFPDAQVYAPAQSIERVERHARISGVRPLADAAALAGENVELIDMPYYRTGELLARLRTARGRAWYVTDIITNMAELPRHPVFGLVYKLSGSGPGIKLNNLASLFMVRDKAALKRWLFRELEEAPPEWLIPAHGEIAHLKTDLAPLRRAFAA